MTEELKSETPSETKPSFGDFVRRRRVQLHLGQGDLAERAGLSQSIISKIELHKTRPGLHISKLASALRCSEEELRSLLPDVPAPIKSELGQTFEKLRQNAGLSIEELAEKTGLTRKRIEDIESRNRRIRITDAQLVTKALGVPVTTLREFYKNTVAAPTSALGKFVRDRREELGMSAQTLAEQIGVSKWVMSALERGKGGLEEQPLHKLAEVLQVSVEDLPEMERSSNKEISSIRLERAYLERAVALLPGRSHTKLAELAFRFLLARLRLRTRSDHRSAEL